MPTAVNKIRILPNLHTAIENLVQQFEQIPSERKSIIHQLTEFIQQGRNDKRPVYVNFICTHNSRRSHLAQIWAQAAAYYYGIEGIECFSGGTEATAFNPRAVKAMKDEGFEISVLKEGENPVYKVRFSEAAPVLESYSKTYDDALNPSKNFAAIMTCSHADQNCPLVVGASKRVSLPYDDPKDFDGTPQECEKYKASVQEIGREMLYAFSQVK